MGLPDRPLTHTDIQYYFSGWGFSHSNNASLWIKTLPGDNSKVLIYYDYRFFITDNTDNVWTSTYFPPSIDEVSLIPVRSVYHVIKLMEARGWFDSPESNMPNQDIAAYRR
ncbi:MAG: hypothetical protein EOO60_09625 [Hymenobacter sp.]|nr:MAG: hypothetical protein EOO60_09625 [Hymenobacter sp.]